MPFWHHQPVMVCTLTLFFLYLNHNDKLVVFMASSYFQDRINSNQIMYGNEEMQLFKKMSSNVLWMNHTLSDPSCLTQLPRTPYQTKMIAFWWNPYSAIDFIRVLHCSTKKIAVCNWYSKFLIINPQFALIRHVFQQHQLVPRSVSVLDHPYLSANINESNPRSDHVLNLCTLIVIWIRNQCE